MFQNPQFTLGIPGEMCVQLDFETPSSHFEQENNIPPLAANPWFVVPLSRR